MTTTANPGSYPGALTKTQQQRAECLAIALELVRGRSVPIQVVERLAVWLYSSREAAE